MPINLIHRTARTIQIFPKAIADRLSARKLMEEMLLFESGSCARPDAISPKGMPIFRIEKDINISLHRPILRVGTISKF